MRAWHFSGLLLALSVAVVACDGREFPTPKEFDGSPAAAEGALRRIGAGTFKVVGFRVAGGEYKQLVDEDRFGLSLYNMRYEADVRLVEDLLLDDREALVARYRESRSEAAVLERDLLLLRLFGPGHYAAGDEHSIEGSAVFEEVETGWRLATVDRYWRLVSE